MKLLGIDTATEACSIALWQDGEIVGRHVVAGRSHSERLRPMLAEVLDEAGLRVRDIDAFVGGIGPGSFAGVRIGVAFVQGLAAALDCPVLPVTSLELLALQGFRGGARSVLAAIDARMGEVYWSAYEADADGFPLSLCAPQVEPPSAVSLPAPAATPTLGIGSGWAAYGESLSAALGEKTPQECRPDALPNIADGLNYAAAQFLRGAGRAVAELQPLYLRNKVALTLDEQRAAKK